MSRDGASYAQDVLHTTTHLWYKKMMKTTSAACQGGRGTQAGTPTHTAHKSQQTRTTATSDTHNGEPHPDMIRQPRAQHNSRLGGGVVYAGLCRSTNSVTWGQCCPPPAPAMETEHTQAHTQAPTIPEAAQAVHGGHANDEREQVVNKGVQGLRAKRWEQRGQARLTTARPTETSNAGSECECEWETQMQHPKGDAARALATHPVGHRPPGQVRYTLQSALNHSVIVHQNITTTTTGANNNNKKRRGWCWRETQPPVAPVRKAWWWARSTLTGS
jgi:hypothetical protein